MRQALLMTTIGPIRLVQWLTGCIIATQALALTTVSAQGAHWYRGNTHTHTILSDGDSPPDSAARWYRDRGYNFLFITDHEKLTDPAPLNARYAVDGKFLLIAGQEVTQRIADSTHADKLRQAHVNALGASRVIMPQGEKGLARGISMREGYDINISAIRSAGGIAQVNHPNFRWSARLSDLLSLPDSTLLEVMNAHTGVNNDGDGVSAPSTEALWDSLLSRGKILFAVGDDDAHSFRPADGDAYDLTRPGRSWIMVRADTLSAASILSGIRRGDFYASTGVTLKTYVANQKDVRVTMQPVYDARYRTEFIGKNGKILATVHGLEASYKIRGSEGYVRVRITDSNGNRALTQATFVKRP